MSYPASRWAQAHTLVIGRDPYALAALKELADAFIDQDGCCSIESLKELALSLGLSKPETASAAVSRLAKIGLVRASNIYSGRAIVGTRFELLGYKKDEWPAERKGKKVWVEVALSKGLSPMPWWPKFKDTRDAGDARGSDDIRQTGVPRETGEGTPRDGGRVPRETGEGYPAKRGSYKGIGKGMERDKERGMAAPDSAGVPEVSEAENPHLDTNPNLAQFDGVPFPDFEEASDDELFAAELIKADKAKAELAPEPEAKPKTRTRKTTAKKADAWPVEDDGVDADTREAYLSVRKAKRVGPFTPKAYEQLAKQATKHGVSVKVALEKCIESGWVFPYDSLFEKEKNHGKTQQSQQKSAFLRPQSEIDYTYGLDRWNRA